MKSLKIFIEHTSYFLILYFFCQLYRETDWIFDYLKNLFLYRRERKLMVLYIKVEKYRILSHNIINLF